MLDFQSHSGLAAVQIRVSKGLFSRLEQTRTRTRLFKRTLTWLQQVSKFYTFLDCHILQKN